MLNLKNYIWVFILASGIFIITSNACCTGNASNKEVSATNIVKENNIVKESDSGVIILNDNTFQEKIKKGVTLVDFWATWCRPCKLQAPIIEEVNNIMAGKASICKLDVDQSPNISQMYNVQSIPTIIIFKDGKAVSQFIGLTEKEQLIDELNKFIK
jgi:thioredoxin 1